MGSKKAAPKKAPAKPKAAPKKAKAKAPKKAPPKEKAPKEGGTAAEQIASGQRDADHFVKWGDLKDLKG
jgi:hypothetical protein